MVRSAITRVYVAVEFRERYPRAISVFQDLTEHKLEQPAGYKAAAGCKDRDTRS